MVKRLRFIGAAVMAIVVTAGVSVGVVSAGAQAGPIRVDQSWSDSRLRILDFDRDGIREMGDRHSARGPLVDPASAERVGVVFWDCVVKTDVFRFERQQGAAVCTTLIQLANGDITLQGLDPASFGASVFAVTGGTGLYRNARGEAEVVDAPDPYRTEITIHLEP